MSRPDAVARIWGFASIAGAAIVWVLPVQHARTAGSFVHPLDAIALPGLVLLAVVVTCVVAFALRLQHAGRAAGPLIMVLSR